MLPSHFKLTRSSNRMGIFPLSFEKFLWSAKYDRENRKVYCPGRATSATHRVKGWVGWASQKAKLTRVSLRNSHSVAVLLQLLFGKVSSRTVVFPSRAFSETPRHSKDSIGPNITLCNVFQLSCEEGASCGILPSHLRITRYSNLMGILPKSF